MKILPHITNRLNAYPIKISTGLFIDTEKLSLRFIWKENSPKKLEKEE
jgi:hypothetical protein